MRDDGHIIDCVDLLSTLRGFHSTFRGYHSGDASNYMVTDGNQITSSLEAEIAFRYKSTNIGTYIAAQAYIQHHRSKL